MSNRRDVLAQLKIVLATIAEVVTVVRVYLETEFDITQYAIADLPLVAIPEPAEETDEEMTSQRSMMLLGTKLIIYFVDWAVDSDVTKLELLSSGYVNCAVADIGKQVKDDGVEIGKLLAYDNTLREWWIRTIVAIADASAMTITGGTGAGTADGDSAVRYQTLVKAIRDKIGANFTLNGTATEARVMSVSPVLGTMPVYNFVMELEMKYYLNEQVT